MAGSRAATCSQQQLDASKAQPGPGKVAQQATPTNLIRTPPLFPLSAATFVANGDVALSVLMTAASTVAATVMTPMLTSLLAGAYIPVDGWVSTILAVVVCPVLRSSWLA